MGQTSLNYGVKKQDGPVECLGLSFENDYKRREHFLNKLREKLNDPDFRKIEGFPLGSDEDILNLSDPPYYTACPNPWIVDFITEWEAKKPAKPDGNRSYHREPFAADVSEGKQDPIYNAHSYHTKVPHKAIMRYILHYTEPGDIVFDGFCGTGMTGVAAQMCGDRNVVMELGYQVRPDGTILCEEIDENSKSIWVPFSRLGVRRAVLNDLSPAATFIAYNYNTPVDVTSFNQEVLGVLEEVEAEYGWMYETLHTDGKSKGKIIYTIWSDVFICPDCSGEVVFWDSAIDTVKADVKDEFPCPQCSAKLTKNIAERAYEAKYDSILNRTIKHAKQVPVLIIYSVDSVKGRFEKKPDKMDLKKIHDIENSPISDWHPSAELPDGYNTRQPIRSHGFDHVHHFYTKRNLIVLAHLFRKASASKFKFLFTGFVGGATKLNQFHLKNYVFGGGGFNPGPRKGTLYAPSISMEVPIISLCQDRLRTQLRAYNGLLNQNIDNIVIATSSTNAISTSSSKELLDYVFIDPPFGANLNYSELSYIWESWFNVFTNNKQEAIENPVQNKGATEYRQLMTSCFSEIYRLLKPGRWLTVEFSNTKASVWNNIQTSLLEAGFIVANVSALDKQQGGINANISKVAVKQDLVISAYKPNGGLEDRFNNAKGSADGVWDFIRTHLKYLPSFKSKKQVAEFINERDPRILYDRMVSYFIQHGLPVPLSSQEFQAGLMQRFAERDGMYFLSEQVAEYDRKRILVRQIEQQSLFVSDERTAIDWLQDYLKAKPNTYQDILPDFMPKLSEAAWKKHEARPELSLLLDQNFFKYDGKGEVPSQIHSYLSTNFKDLRNLPKDSPLLKAKAKDRWYVPDPNKAQDLEKLREKSLLKEFEEYRGFSGRKLKTFRLEAIRAGFKRAWGDKDYPTIITVAQKVPEDVLQEDPKLIMWYDGAMTRMGD